jgi:hypothetical protein
MDINSILPILLKNNQSAESPNASKENIGTNQNSQSADSMQLITSLLSGNADQSTLINSLAKNSGNPQLAQTLSLAQNLKNNTKKNNPMGLKAIKPFVNNDIMGKLTKYFN